MKIDRRLALTAGLGTALSGLTFSAARADLGDFLAGAFEGLDDFWVATDAYIYGYPLVTVEMTRRVATNVPKVDYAAVHALQDQCKLVPLSAWGKDYTPPQGTVDPAIDMKTPVRDQVNKMDAVEYFTLLAQLLKTNPPAAADAPEIARFAEIGLVPGKDFDASKLNADFVKRIPQVAYDRIMLQFKVGKAVKNTNGWVFDTMTGIYGTDYLNRALVTAVGLGANRIQDAVYPMSLKDVDGNAYNGSNKYVMHFAKGQTPPARGFWSLTMYDAQFFFVANPINRYSISPRQNLKANPDGSIDLYIQNQSPGADKETNWLPAPSDKFVLMLRMYWPDEKPPSIIDGTWSPPAVRKVG